VYVVRLRRLEGDEGEYRKVKQYIFDKCAPILTGLPDWALELQDQKLLNENDQSNVNEEQNFEDDYDNFLKNDIDVSQ